MKKFVESEEKLKRLYSKLRSNPAIILILLLGIAARVYAFGKVPPGLNADEASIGYDAFALLNYGIDRNGFHNPVHMVAWGSGQNALYAYLSMPFIYLFGLTPFSIRLVNLIFGIGSVFIFYLLVKRISNKEIGLICAFLASINTWHIMISRWALESNLFPAIFLLGAYFLVLSYDKQRFLPLSFLMFAISLYSYGISYFFICIFMLVLVPYLIYYKKYSLKNFILSSLVFIVAAMPIMLFVAINYLKLNSIVTPLFSIPRLTGSAQFMNESSIFNKDFIKNSIDNFLFFLNFFIKQDDVIWNLIPKYGFMYLFSLPFVILGGYRLFVNQFRDSKFRKSFIMIPWLVAAILLTFAVKICTNRINILFFPLIFLTGLGIFYIKNRVGELLFSLPAVVAYMFALSFFTYKGMTVYYILVASLPLVVFGVIIVPSRFVAEDKNKIKARTKKFLIAVVTLYIVFFGLFCKDYFTVYPEQSGPVFYESFGEAIEYAADNSRGTVCVTDKANMPYIYVLFYTQTTPKEFIETVQYINPGSAFQGVSAFGRFQFGISDLSTPQNPVYILHNSEMDVFNKQGFDIKQFKLYSVAVKRS